jgi:hypothetical protein
MMEFCTPLVEKGGCDTAYVMPNLQPPIMSVSDAVAYHQQLSRLAPNITFLMSLFLHPGLNADIIAEAAQTGIIYGVRILTEQTRLAFLLRFFLRLLESMLTSILRSSSTLQEYDGFCQTQAALSP